MKEVNLAVGRAAESVFIWDGLNTPSAHFRSQAVATPGGGKHRGVATKGNAPANLDERWRIRILGWCCAAIGGDPIR